MIALPPQPVLGHFVGGRWLDYVAYAVPLGLVAIATARERILMRRDRRRTLGAAGRERETKPEGRAS